jgi:hypothetical protein
MVLLASKNQEENHEWITSNMSFAHFPFRFLTVTATYETPTSRNLQKKLQFKQITIR